MCLLKLHLAETLKTIVIDPVPVLLGVVLILNISISIQIEIGVQAHPIVEGLVRVLLTMTNMIEAGHLFEGHDLGVQ